MSPSPMSQAQLPVRVFPLIRRISARVTPALAALDLIWVLLPLGAVGAQVYWVTRFIRGAGEYHV